MSALRSFARRHDRLTGALCLLLLLFGTTIQVAHAHPDESHHADCALCLTAHATVDIVVLPTGFSAPVTTLERTIRPTPPPAPQALLAHPLWHRPPPSLPIA